MALELFQQMQQEGAQPDSVTFVGFLNACSSVVAFEEGYRSFKATTFCMHVNQAIPHKDIRLHKMPSQDVVNWNAILEDVP
jgi:hypothetical protein